MPLVDVTTHYLQMLDPARLRRKECQHAEWQLRRAARDFAINRDFYRDVGGGWYWIDRLAWPDQRWQEYVAHEGLETWIGYLDAQRVGYFELDHQPTTGVEIAYFGLLPAYIGRGLGGLLLCEAVDRAWALAPRRVWLHTCSLDHPQALANYQARGFEIYKVETQRQDIPEGRA
jgi:ribosomal protein S18 acetylase RimI-like enzyme